MCTTQTRRVFSYKVSSTNKVDSMALEVLTRTVTYLFSGKTVFSAYIHLPTSCISSITCNIVVYLHCSIQNVAGALKIQLIYPTRLFRRL